jgi:AraC-like DNA-binding protein
MDLLSDVLLSLKVESSAIGHFRLTEPWGLDINGFEPAFCYCVAEGHCWVLPDDRPPVLLEPGDTVLLPHGGRCVIASAPNAPLVTASELWHDRALPFYSRGNSLAAPLLLRLGGSGKESRIVSLAFSFRDERRNALLSSLPDLIILPGKNNGTAQWVTTATQFLTAEEADARHGYIAIASRLAELLFQSLIRAYILSTPNPPTGWLRGLLDTRIGKALSAIHASPGEDWTVASLAHSAGMSRSAFAERFQHLLGRTPIDYLTEWRMQLAAELLAASKRPVAIISHELGYQSETAFREAFKRQHGLPPNAYRKAQRQPDNSSTAV